MFIRVYNHELNVAGEIDNIASLILERDFFGGGRFEMHLPYSEDIWRLLSEDHFLFINNRGDKAVICEDYEVADSREHVKVKGISLDSLLSRRIVLPMRGDNYIRFNNMPPEDIMYGFVSSQCISPQEFYRKMDILVLGNSLGRGESIHWRASLDSTLIETLYEVGVFASLGHCIHADTAKKKIVFSVIKGRDLSVLQKDNPPVIFSYEYDNLSSVLYREEGNSEKNAVYALWGDLELNEHIIYTAKNEKAAGIHLKEECFNPGAADLAELTFKGTQRLSETERKVIVRAGIDHTGSFIYEKDWDLGDIVTVVHKDAGKIMHEQITKVTEIYEQGQMRLEAVFGLENANFRQRIENIERKVRL